MTAYSVSGEETLRARNLLNDWAAEGFITPAQHQILEQETACDFRRTNIFLRLILCLFTVVIGVAAAVLFFSVFLPHIQNTGIFLLVFAALAYAASEFAVSRFRLYRFGIEEALLACSVGFLCVGLYETFFRAYPYSPTPYRAESLVPLAGTAASLWIWHRFGLPYAPLAAMIFVLFIPDYWTASPASRHVTPAAFYVAGIIAVIAVRPRSRLTYLDAKNSVAEALLWLGIYLAINLQLSSLSTLADLWSIPRAAAEFSRPFYWTTWVLTWSLPPVVLARGLRLKDRLVIGAGTLAAVLTFVTNKPYLGWPRHTWDPMLLGALLIAVALFIRRWLAAAPNETRHGFTTRRLSGRDKSWMNAGSVALGLVSPNIVPPGPQTTGSDVHFGGGDAGGGGASSNF